MIRPFTLIAMLLAALSGAYLFAVKHRAQVLDDEIASLENGTRLDVMQIKVLQGQWSMETDPTRLQQLAAQFTTLQPMQPAQLVTLAALRESLPPPGSAVPASNPALPGQTVPQVAAPEVAQNATAPNGLPLPPPQAPKQAAVQLASIEMVGSPAMRPAETRVIAHRVSHSALHLATNEMAAAVPPPKPFYAPRIPRDAQPNEPSGVTGQTLPMGAQVMSVRATAMTPQYAPPVMASQDSGSVLGMASDLAPPQPMPQNGSDN